MGGWGPGSGVRQRSRHHIKPRWEDLVALLDRLRRRAEAAGKRVDRVVLAYEAGRGAPAQGGDGGSGAQAAGGLVALLPRGPHPRGGRVQAVGPDCVVIPGRRQGGIGPKPARGAGNDEAGAQDTLAKQSKVGGAPSKP